MVSNSSYWSNHKGIKHRIMVHEQIYLNCIQWDDKCRLHHFMLCVTVYGAQAQYSLQ